MARLPLLRWLVVAAALVDVGVHAQPSPQVQKRITAAIKAAATSNNIDYTEFVNPFIGTGVSISKSYCAIEFWVTWRAPFRQLRRCLV